jgi:hypothetical protein
MKYKGPNMEMYGLLPFLEDEPVRSHFEAA